MRSFLNWALVAAPAIMLALVLATSVPGLAQTDDASFETTSRIYQTDKAMARAMAQKAADQGEPWGWRFLAYITPLVPPNSENAKLWRSDIEHYVDAAIKTKTPVDFSEIMSTLIGNDPDIAWVKTLVDHTRAGGLAPKSGDENVIAGIDVCAAAGDAALPEADVEKSKQKFPVSQNEDRCEELRASGKLEDFGLCMLTAKKSEGYWLVTSSEQAEIYANGWGVARNIKLATALTCRGWMSLAEWEGTLKDLATRTKDPALQLAAFNVCDFATSSLQLGMCARRSSEASEVQRKAELAAITAAWPAAHVQAFAALQPKAEAYFDSNAHAEQDLSGFDRAQLVFGAENTFRYGLLDAIKAFERGLLPTDADFAKADKALNETYAAEISKLPSDDDTSAVTQDGVRATQRLWLAYRDALAQFGTLRYPGTTAAAWKTYATRQRIDTLNAIGSVDQ